MLSWSSRGWMCVSVREGESSKSRWDFSFLQQRVRICCNKQTMAILLTSLCSVVGNWHMHSLMKRPSFIWAGQHLIPDGIRTLCSTNTAVWHSGDTTTNFGPGFLQTTQNAWVFTVDLRAKDTEDGLATRFLFSLVSEEKLVAEYFRRSFPGREHDFSLDSL